ncbi:hypothetical protein MRB53_032294 [Persea americana]|uniref:Uncharacterized protein n=1 Tax=Persea americana TaxID=3435 RepID=A0ACC2KRF0_PERAE|nr:hypothetical protein MRB53_032294 [Persea americana]
MHLIPGFHAPRLDATDHRAQCPNHEPLLITKIYREERKLHSTHLLLEESIRIASILEPSKPERISSFGFSSFGSLCLQCLEEG